MKKCIGLLAALILFFGVSTTILAQGCFIRGDFNGDGTVNWADTTGFTNFIFLGTSVPPCIDAADLDDNGIFTSFDVVLLLNTAGGFTIPPPPFPICGLDPTADGITCLISRGDMNSDGLLTSADAVLSLNCVFLGICSCACCADTNCDGFLASADVVFELNFVFLGTPLPPCICP